ncbi:hypothetical protein KSP40_PGU008336 [Platanthera guangdongensis]|uniref:Uncharacterized protein n=1 Tax=Platanthera guangdongensis TaxID=2320717 RepID=A0ABR2MWF0_9ASPA
MKIFSHVGVWITVFDLSLTIPLFYQGKSNGLDKILYLTSRTHVLQAFVLQRQLLIFSSGGCLAEQPPLSSPLNSPSYHPTETVGLDSLAPKSGSEINFENALPCRIAFERGKERHLSFLAFSKGVSGWIILLEELPLNRQRGVVRVAAPLAGSDPRIDENHPKWLHLRIRPPNLPAPDVNHDQSRKSKAKVLIDGRWTLAFKDVDACRSAESMVVDEMRLLQSQVEQRLKPLVEDHVIHDSSNTPHQSSDEPSPNAG